MADQDSWGFDEHPDFPMRDWRFEVACEDTRLGYAEWLQSKLEQKAVDDVIAGIKEKHGG